MKCNLYLIKLQTRTCLLHKYTAITECGNFLCSDERILIMYWQLRPQALEYESRNNVSHVYSYIAKTILTIVIFHMFSDLLFY